MSKQTIPYEYFLNLPSDAPDWMKSLVNDISYALRVIAMRADLVVIEGITSERPLPDGSKRFFFDTSTNTMYYDYGYAWLPLGTSTSAGWFQGAGWFSAGWFQ